MSRASAATIARPIGATAPHPTVELGADSPLSVRVLQEWLGGAVR